MRKEVWSGSAGRSRTGQNWNSKNRGEKGSEKLTLPSLLVPFNGQSIWRRGKVGYLCFPERGDRRKAE